MAVTRNRPAGPASRMHVAADPVDDWREQARCRDWPDPDNWYPVSNNDLAEDPAKRICAGCPVPVKARCLQEALDRGDDHGVWGGTGPGDRRRIRAGKLTIAQALIYRHPKQMADVDA